VLVEDNQRTKIWRSTVAGWISRSVPARFNAEKGQPLGAEITFTLPRPKGHYGTGKNSDLLKGTAPAHPVSHSTGDVDKLLRLALDALQDTPVLPDDCAVIEVTTRKAYIRTTEQRWDDVLGYPGVVIRLYPIEDT
jgi:crossover junction endodeoxyribonuclease RusA